MDAAQNLEKMVRRPKSYLPDKVKSERKFSKAQHISLAEVSGEMCRIIFEYLDRKDACWKTAGRKDLIRQLLERGCLDIRYFQKTDHAMLVSRKLDELITAERIFFTESDGMVELSRHEHRMQRIHAKARERVKRQRSEDSRNQQPIGRVQLETP